MALGLRVCVVIYSFNEKNSFYCSHEKIIGKKPLGYLYNFLSIELGLDCLYSCCV